MASTLTEQLSNVDSRLEAVESDGLDESALLSRVFKLYEDIELSVNITYSKHQYVTCSTTRKCSTSLII